MESIYELIKREGVETSTSSKELTSPRKLRLLLLAEISPYKQSLLAAVVIKFAVVFIIGFFLFKYFYLDLVVTVLLILSSIHVASELFVFNAKINLVKHTLKDIEKENYNVESKAPFPS